MDSDDAVDALEDLDDTDKNEIVNKLDKDSVEDVKMLLSYDEDEIGSRMTTNYISIKNDMTHPAGDERAGKTGRRKRQHLHPVCGG